MEHACVSSPAEHQEYIDVAGGDTGYATGLGDGLGVYPGQLLPGFGGEGLQGVVVKLTFNLDAFQSGQLVGYHPFALDVAAVLYLYLGGFDDFVASLLDAIEFALECINVLCHILQSELRAVDEVHELAAVA